MITESKKWFEQARKDLKAAKDSLNSENYEWACFQAQQSSEKALKALHIKRYKHLLKVHDLVLLAKRINAPNEIIASCSKINPSYADTRYPDMSKIYSKEDAKVVINLTGDVLKWIEKNL